MTERLDLWASRNETWRATIDLPYTGGALPLTGASISLQWRLYEGAAGSPLVSLVGVAFEDVLANAEDQASGIPDGVRILRLFPLINQSVLEALPTGRNQPEPGDADRYVWDAIITYSDGVTDRPVQGFVYLGKGTVRA